MAQADGQARVSTLSPIKILEPQELIGTIEGIAVDGGHISGLANDLVDSRIILPLFDIDDSIDRHSWLIEIRA